MHDRWVILITIAGFTWMTIGLMFIAYQTMTSVRILAEITALIARTH